MLTRHSTQPTVIPLSDDDDDDNNKENPQEALFFEEALFAQQPADAPGRFASFADYHALYKSGAATPLQVVRALLPLINRAAVAEADKQYSLAWLDVHEERVLAAARASTARWAAGKPLGLLDGVPFGVKADCDVEGYVNTMGMKVDARHGYFARPAASSLWPVRKLEEAGAVMVGKMNQHEVGMDTTGCNPNTGTPVNFYNRAYYPGGSSSGAGSALGAGLVPLCVGTDAGGSIRIPSAAAGCVALKPTHNRTTAMRSSMCVVGPMCANVDDLTAAYRVMAQADPEDPVTGLFAPSRLPPPGTADKKYLGVCRPWVALAKPEIRALFDKAVAYYTARGYQVVDIDLPLLQEGQTAHGAVNLAEAADKAKARHRVVVPSPDGSSGNKQPKGRWTDLLTAPNAVTCAVGGQTTANDYMKFAQVRAVVMRHLAFLFETHGAGLLVLSPVCPDAGYPKRSGDEWLGFTDGNRTLRSMTYVWLSNMSGCPSATVPMGYATPPHRLGDPAATNKIDKALLAGEQEQEQQGRLPAGLLAMGMWGEEERLLAWAEEGEAYLRGAYPGGRAKPDAWVDVIARAKEGVFGGSSSVGGNEEEEEDGDVVKKTK